MLFASLLPKEEAWNMFDLRVILVSVSGENVTLFRDTLFGLTMSYFTDFLCWCLMPDLSSSPLNFTNES